MLKEDENYINHEVRLQLQEATSKQILNKLDKLNSSVSDKIDKQNNKIDGNFRWLLASILTPVILHAVKLI